MRNPPASIRIVLNGGRPQTSATEVVVEDVAVVVVPFVTVPVVVVPVVVALVAVVVAVVVVSVERGYGDLFNAGGP